ncbi:AraC family transcriptional regulator [Mycoplasmatota bacterium]|nr:AraC family transcriptional regulator [Mycoplasmatota bacterium]
MDYKEHIEKALFYIEKHLFEKLTNELCAKSCGYSEYHFLRIFKAVTGYTPMDYIRKRRLTEASKLLLETDMSLEEIAFNSGFNSIENFIRVFHSEHNVTPGLYRQTKSSLHLLNPIFITTKIEFKQPIIKKMDEITIIAYRFKTNMRDRHYDIPKFWNKYHSKKMYDNLTRLINKNRVDIGYCKVISDEEVYYYIGVESEYKDIRKLDLFTLTFPKSMYAVFKSPKTDKYNFVEMIHQTWNYIYVKWLPDSDFIQSSIYAFESYNESSRSYSEKIYIPIKMEE